MKGGFVQQIKQKQDDFKRTIRADMTSPNQRAQTPNQRNRTPNCENSSSPTIFRTPQISLHYDKKPQPSNNRSQHDNLSTFKEQDSATKDYSRVLDEVMKKYRQLQSELQTKEKEVQRTQYYKDLFLKEKKRNEQLIERNKQLKNSLLKVIELVQQDQLQTEEDEDASLRVENHYLRKMLNLYDVKYEDNEIHQEQDTDLDFMDVILSKFLTDLKTIEHKRKNKEEQQNQGLALTVLNKESSFIDLSEDKMLMEQ
ncbi:hypothetical protein pb186bvf_010844 [Paramecium bursaria]